MADSSEYKTGLDRGADGAASPEGVGDALNPFEMFRSEEDREAREEGFNEGQKLKKEQEMREEEREEEGDPS